MRQLEVKIDQLAMDVLLNVLGNIVLMLESGKDPMRVAQEIRDYIARRQHGRGRVPAHVCRSCHPRLELQRGCVPGRVPQGLRLAQACGHQRTGEAELMTRPLTQTEKDLDRYAQEKAYRLIKDVVQSFDIARRL